MKKSFTIIELIISIAILSLILGFSTPSLINFNNSTRIDSAMEELVSVIKKAQGKSINAEKDTTWGIDFSQPSSYLLFSQDGYQEKYEIDGKIKLAKTGNQLVFEKLSGKVGDSFEINLTLENKSYKININSEGMIECIQQ